MSEETEKEKILSGFSGKLLKQTYGSEMFLSQLMKEQARQSMAASIINSSRRMALATGLRPAMEAVFGFKMDDVGIHTDAAANQAADMLGARAFTKGKDIYFGEGESNFETSQGKALLAHELTHVGQNKGATEHIQLKPVTSAVGGTNEAQAEIMEHALPRLITSPKSQKGLVEINDVEIKASPGHQEKTLRFLRIKTMIEGLIEPYIYREVLKEPGLSQYLITHDIEVEMDLGSISLDGSIKEDENIAFHVVSKLAREAIRRAREKMLQSLSQGGLSGKSEIQMKKAKTKSGNSLGNIAIKRNILPPQPTPIPRYEFHEFIPSIPKFKYYGNIFDWAAAFNNSFINIVNGFPYLVNGLISESAYIVQYGPGNYLSAAGLSLKQTGLNIAKHFKNEWKYIATTTFKKQMSDTLRTFADPAFWEEVGTIIGSIALTRKIGGAISSKTKSVINNVQKASRIRKPRMFKVNKMSKRDIKSSKVFNKVELKPEAQQALNKFKSKKPSIGGNAKQLSRKLNNVSEKKFLKIMEKEVKTGKCVRIKGPKGDPIMWKYEYPDGTLVRYKPNGDIYRPGPTYSVEVKHTPVKPDTGPGDIAFKVDEKARAVPKNPKGIKNPFPEGTLEHDKFLDAIMNAGHKSLKKQ